MAKILAIAGRYPDPTMASGDVRFHALLGAIAQHHQVTFCALDNRGAVIARTATATDPLFDK